MLVKASKREVTACDIRPKPRKPMVRLAEPMDGPTQSQGDQGLSFHCSASARAPSHC